jgi:hypothetical protein
MLTDQFTKMFDPGTVATVANTAALTALTSMIAAQTAAQGVGGDLGGLGASLVSGLFGSAGGGLGAVGSYGSAMSATTSLPSFLATGGPAQAGSPYIVGEKGPELFVPSVGGDVLNADDTQQALEQSRSAAAFSDNRKALNRVSSTSREQRTEKWLSSGATSTEIKYSRVGSGDLPFVTEEDMLQATRVAAQEGARMGQQRTMAALKGNPGARRSIGI